MNKPKGNKWEAYMNSIQGTHNYAKIVSNQLKNNQQSNAVQTTVQMFKDLYSVVNSNNYKNLCNSELGDFDYLLPNFNKQSDKTDVTCIRLKQKQTTKTRDVAEITIYYTNKTLCKVILTKTAKNGAKVNIETSNYQIIKGENTVKEKFLQGA